MLIISEISACGRFSSSFVYLYLVPSVVQISIEETKGEEGHAVVRWIISAASSKLFSSSSAKVHFLPLQLFPALDCYLSATWREFFLVFGELFLVSIPIVIGTISHTKGDLWQALAAQFEQHTVQLPEIFGSYQLRSWKGLPRSKW